MLMRRPSNHTTKGPGRADRKGLTSSELLRKFPDDATAQRWFEELRWKHRPTCPDCRSSNHGHCPSHPSMPYTCKDCRKRFSVRKGTLMQSSKLGYQVWAVAFYMAATNLTGISSMKLHRELGITQKTAWHMLQRIREVFRDGEVTLSGIVELDEVYLGGKERNKHASQKLKAGRGSVGKTAVVGAKQRGGQVAAQPVPATDAQTLGGFVQATVEPGSTLDPPCNSNRHDEAPIGSEAAGAALQATWTLSDVDRAWLGWIAEREPALASIIDAAELAHGKGLQS